MATSRTFQLYYDGSRNTIWEDNCIDWWCESYMDEPGLAEVHLDNVNGDFGEGGVNEIDTSLKRLEIQLDATLETHWSGFIYEVDTSEEGVAIVKAGDLAWFMDQKRIYCHQRKWSGNYSPKLIIGASGGIAGAADRTVYPPDFPFVGIGALARTIGCSTYAGDDGPGDADMFNWEFSDGTSIFSAIEELRAYCDYVAWWQLDIDNDWRPRCAFRSPLYSTEASEMKAALSEVYSEYPAGRRVANYLKRGAKSASYEEIVLSELARTRQDYYDRVVVYGADDGIVGLAGAGDETDSLRTLVIKDSAISDRGVARQRARWLLDTLNAERWEGSITVEMDTYHCSQKKDDNGPLGGIYKIEDSQITDQTLYLVARGSKTEYSKAITTIFFGEQYGDIQKALRGLNISIKKVQSPELATGNVFTCDNFFEDDCDMSEEGFYAVTCDHTIAAAGPGAPAGRLQVSWTISDEQPSTDLSAAGFVEYIVEYKQGAGSLGVPKWRGFTQAGPPGTIFANEWGSAQDANLANINTNNTIITGLVGGAWYTVRLWVKTTKVGEVPYSDTANGQAS